MTGAEPSLGVRLGRSVLWVSAGVWLGALLLSLPFTLWMLGMELLDLASSAATTDRDGSFDLDLFELPAMGFLFVLVAGGFEVVPLAVLNVLLDRRARRLGRAPGASVLRALVLAGIAGGGVLVWSVADLVRHGGAPDDLLQWIPVALLTSAVAALGLVGAKAVLDGVARAGLARSLAGVALVLALTASTALVETTMTVDCDDYDSCFETVQCRGFPYPFMQPDFDLGAFLYDAATLSLPLLAAAFRRRSGAANAAAEVR